MKPYDFTNLNNIMAQIRRLNVKLVCINGKQIAPLPIGPSITLIEWPVEIAAKLYGKGTCVAPVNTEGKS